MFRLKNVSKAIVDGKMQTNQKQYVLDIAPRHIRFHAFGGLDEQYAAIVEAIVRERQQIVGRGIMESPEFSEFR
jgi:hypothetical protein